MSCDPWPVSLFYLVRSLPHQIFSYCWFYLFIITIILVFLFVVFAVPVVELSHYETM